MNAVFVDAAQQEMEESTPGIPLYYPGDDFVLLTVGNDLGGEGGPIGKARFVLVPDGTAVNPDTKHGESHDGVTLIRDHYEFVWAKQDGKRVRTNQRRLCLSSVTAVNHILKKFSDRGVIKLKGSATDQEKQKHAAREKHLKWKRAAMQAVVDTFNHKQAIWASNPANKGQFQPRADDDVINAMEWLADDQEKRRAQRAAFVCEHCMGAYETDDEPKYERHLKTFHAAVWAALQNPESEVPAPERKKPGPKPGSRRAETPAN